MINDRIEIDSRTSIGKFSNAINYSELDTRMIHSIVNNERIKYIQMSKNLPNDALIKIDEVLGYRTDLIFRLYGMYKDNPFNLERLQSMNNIRNLHLDMLEKKGYRRFENLESITRITGVSSLYLSIVGDCDINFISNIHNLKHLYLFIEQGSVALSDFYFHGLSLEKLQLGGEAIKYTNYLDDQSQIKKLVLFQGSLSNYDFLEKCNIEELYMFGCKIVNLSLFPKVNGVKKLGFAEIDNKEQLVSKFNDLEIVSEYNNIYEVDL